MTMVNCIRFVPKDGCEEIVFELAAKQYKTLDGALDKRIVNLGEGEYASVIVWKSVEDFLEVLNRDVRLIDVLSKRPQLQERLTEQIVNLIDLVLSPEGVAVIISAEHMCMSLRGVNKVGATIKTVASRGLLSTQNDRFKEFETIVSKEK